MELELKEMHLDDFEGVILCEFCDLSIIKLHSAMNRERFLYTS